MSKPYFLPDKYSMSVKIDKLEKQLAKANERIAELEKQFETQMTNDFVTITDQAKRITDLEKYNLDLANESHNKSCAIDRANESIDRANESIAIYKGGISNAIDAIEREDDSSAHDAVTYLESALRLQKTEKE